MAHGYLVNNTNTRSMSEAMNALLTLQSKGNQLQKSSSTRAQTLRIMKNYLNRLNIDPSQLSVIHVAGTKGKGSTCAMVESILRENKFSTGLFTSPHLISVCERFRVNGTPIDEPTFLRHFWSVWDGLHATKDQAEDYPPIAGFFRFLTLVALRLFLEQGVDAVILEVGLGGRLDATNIIEKPVVCGITTLDLDHTNVLGSTIDKIAYEKGGILKPGVPSFTVAQEPLALAKLKQCATDAHASLEVLPSIKEFMSVGEVQLGLKGEYQKTNAALAVVLAKTWLNTQKELPAPSIDSVVLDDACLRGLANCRWAGRSQILHHEPSRNTYYLDGAHTLKSMEACVEWVNHSLNQSTTTPNQKKALVFYCSHDRDIASIIQPLMLLHFDYIIFCPADSTRPTLTKIPTVEEVLRKGGQSCDGFTEVERDTELLWQNILMQVWIAMMNDKKNTEIKVLPSIASTIEFFNRLDAPVSVLVTGSLYLIGGVLSALHWTIDHQAH